MSTRKPKFLRWIFANLNYKVLAFIISCTIWYVVQGEEILEVTRKLDVTFEVPQGLAIREGKNVSRDVTLRGPRVALSDFSNKPIQAVIRIPNGKKGAQRFRIDKNLIPEWDNRIKLTVHDPYIITYIDDRASRSVPVKVAIFGSPKKGTTIKDIVSEPTEITVTGLKSDIQKLQEISTEVVDIGGISEGKSIPVPLSLAGLPDYDLSAQQVVVHVNVFESSVTKSFDSMAIAVLGTDRPINLIPLQVSVVVQGSAEAMSKITPKDIVVIIDAKDLSPGRYEREISVRTSGDVFVTSVVPKKATLEIFGNRRGR